MRSLARDQAALSRKACTRVPGAVLTRGRFCVRAFKTEEAKLVNGASQQQQFNNQLEALASMTKVVADTGEPALVRKYKPTDTTTNPSLVLKAVQNPEYAHMLGEALMASSKDLKNTVRPFAAAADLLAVKLGAEMLQIVPGRVSTEVDAHLSHDTRATVDKALKIVDLYGKLGVTDPKRLYIKIASTWEGIEACRQLQKQGIDCNLTLLFSFAQAAAAADAGAALISPFVGRIMDWYKEKEGREFAPHEDPGVLSVRKIYRYYKGFKYDTIVMAASFRNVGEIRELAGCDNITIAPNLLEQLEASTDPLPRKLFPDMDIEPGMTKHEGMSRDVFDRLHDADQMAVDKLKQGIASFASDQVKLEAMLAKAANAM